MHGTVDLSFAEEEFLMTKLEDLTQRLAVAHRRVEKMFRGARPGRLNQRFYRISRLVTEVPVTVTTKEGSYVQMVRVSLLGYAGHLQQLVFEAQRVG